MPAASGGVALWDNGLCRRLFHGRGSAMVALFSTAFVGCHWAIASHVTPEPEWADGSAGLLPSFSSCVTYATFALYLLAIAAPPGAVSFSRQATLDIMETGRKAMVCRTCNTLRPVRSKHCPVCDVCVGKFDHHCVWTNNCVGCRNIAVFYCFLACLALDLCLTSWTCATNLYVDAPPDAAGAEDVHGVALMPGEQLQLGEGGDNEGGDALELGGGGESDDPLDDGAFVNEHLESLQAARLAAQAGELKDSTGEILSLPHELVVPPPCVLSPVMVLLMLIAMAAAAFVVPLLIVHTHQIAADITTNEAINSARYPYLQKDGLFHNPFDRGAAVNIGATVRAALHREAPDDVSWDRVEMFTVSDVKEHTRSRTWRTRAR